MNPTDDTGPDDVRGVLRVALVMEQALAPVPGGTGRYSLELARALGGDDTLSVTGWTGWHRDVRPAQVDGVAGPRRTWLPRRLLATGWQHGAGPAPGSAHVVHAPTLLVPPRRGRPLVVTIHDVVPWTHPEVLTPRGVQWHRTMADRAARYADRVVVPTRAVAEQLQHHLDLRRAPDVVGLGVTPLPVPVDAGRRSTELGLPTGGYVLSLATVEPRKGLDVLLEAMARPQAPDLPIVVVGPRGWGDVSVDGLAARSGLASGRVLHLGRLSDADLAVVLSQARVLAVPSRAEGFGLPVLEGMAAGVPVVTSADPALVEVGGGATVLAPIGDALATAEALAAAAEDGPLRGRCIAAGRRRAAQFSWAATAAEIAAIYRSVV